MQDNVKEKLSNSISVRIGLPAMLTLDNENNDLHIKILVEWGHS